jgi:uncharacterized protein YqhQ
MSVNTARMSEKITRMSVQLVSYLHSACGNNTLRVLITLERVVITLVSVIFTPGVW